MKIKCTEEIWYVNDMYRDDIIRLNKKDYMRKVRTYGFDRMPWSTVIRSMRLWVNILQQCELDDEIQHILTEALQRGQKRLQTIKTQDVKNCPYHRVGHCKLSDYTQPFQLSRRCRVQNCPFRVFPLEDLLKIKIL
ncbi:hypothetical protein J7M07_04255 [bacterium]|nr:hypothetical protein [bacterium]